MALVERVVGVRSVGVDGGAGRRAEAEDVKEERNWGKRETRRRSVSSGGASWQ